MRESEGLFIHKASSMYALHQARKSKLNEIRRNSSMFSQSLFAPPLAFALPNNFSTRKMYAGRKIFRRRVRPQPQPNPAVRDSLPDVTEKVEEHLLPTPLTGVLAGLKSATRLNAERSVAAAKRAELALG